MELQDKEINRVDLGCCEMVTTYSGHHIEHKNKKNDQKWELSSSDFHIEYNKPVVSDK